MPPPVAAFVILLLATACASKTAPRTARAGQETSPSRARSNEPVRVVSAAAPVSVDARGPLGPAAAVPVAPEPSPERPVPTAAIPPPGVEVERPHLLAERPRAEGRVQASMDDEELARWNVGGSSDPAHVANRRGFHPAVRVVIDTTVIDGFVPERSRKVLSKKRILNRTRDKGYWGVRACYEDLLRETDAKSAKLAMRVDIGGSGRVARTVLQHVDVEDRAAASRFALCTAEALSSIVYRPAPGRRVRVDVGVKLWPGDAPLPDAPTPVREPLDAENAAIASACKEIQPSIGAFADEHRSTVAECFAAGRARDTRLWGRIAVALTFAPDGRVVAVSQSGSHFPDAGVVACVVDELAASALDRPHGCERPWVIAYRMHPEPGAQ